MEKELILSRIDGAVYEIQINRPEKLNAITDAMYGELVANLEKAEKDPAIKVVLLRSSGAHFSAGNDLADFLETRFDLDSHVVQFLVTLARLSKPLVVAVNGAAVGIGTTLLLHCDLVLAAKDAKFSVPFIKLGLTPEGGSSQLLAKRCGVARANDWLLTGRNVLADEALQAGLVNQVFDDASATWEAATKMAQGLSRSSLEVLVESKRLLKAPPIDDVVQLIHLEARVFGERLQSDEAKAAFSAFLDR